LEKTKENKELSSHLFDFRIVKLWWGNDLTNPRNLLLFEGQLRQILEIGLIDWDFLMTLEAKLILYFLNHFEWFMELWGLRMTRLLPSAFLHCFSSLHNCSLGISKWLSFNFLFPILISSHAFLVVILEKKFYLGCQKRSSSWWNWKRIGSTHERALFCQNFLISSMFNNVSSSTYQSLCVEMKLSQFFILDSWWN